MVAEQKSLANRRGRTLTADENRIVLALLLALQLQEQKTTTDAVDQVAEWIGSSNKTVVAVWKQWQEQKTVPQPRAQLRGAAAAGHPWRRSLLTADATAVLQLSLLIAQQKAKHCSARILCNQLRTEHNIDVSRWTVRRWLGKLGYRWRKSRSIGPQTEAIRAKRIRAFLKEYAAALKKEEAGEVVLVYIDESFVHTNHYWRWGWFSVSNEVHRKSGRGTRLILFHALTKDGLLAKRDRDGTPFEATNVITDAAFNAELVFEGLNLEEDYHKSVDGDVFISWVQCRLIPAFKALYPGKKMVLVLDNAPCHHAHAADWKNPNRMTKLEIAQWLVDQSFRDIKITRDGEERTFGLASLFSSRASKYSPSVDEMRGVMKAHLAAHPELNQTRLQKIFSEKNYQLIFTPPYTPQVQPIELLWAHVKNYVARHSDANTDVKGLQALVRKGFYGDEETQHEGAGEPLCGRLRNHCHKWMNTFIQNDEDLSGTLEELVVAGEPQADVFDDADEAENEDDDDDESNDDEDDEGNENDDPSED